MTGEQDDIESLAGEYVLGLLSEAEGEAFERRLESDAALRRAVRDARDRFHELDATAPTAAAPDGLWQRIESRLDGGAGGTVMAFRAKPRTTLRTAAFWKGVAAACIVGAIALPLSWQAIAPPKPELVVVLLDRRSNPGAIVEAFGDRRIRVVPLERFEVPPGGRMPPQGLDDCLEYARWWKAFGASRYWVTAPWAELGPEETGVREPGKRWSGIEARLRALGDFKKALGSDF